MPATTKRGRTRNRKVVQQGAPPPGMPQLLVADGFTVVSPTEFKVAYFNSALEQQMEMIIDPSAQLSLTLGGDPTPIPCNVSFDPLDSTLHVVFPTARTSGDALVLLPWNTGVRGFNGEWLTMQVFIWT